MVTGIAESRVRQPEVQKTQQVNKVASDVASKAAATLAKQAPASSAAQPPKQGLTASEIPKDSLIAGLGTRFVQNQGKTEEVKQPAEGEGAAELTEGETPAVTDNAETAVEDTTGAADNPDTMTVTFDQLERLLKAGNDNLNITNNATVDGSGNSNSAVSDSGNSEIADSANSDNDTTLANQYGNGLQRVGNSADSMNCPMPATGGGGGGATPSGGGMPSAGGVPSAGGAPSGGGGMPAGSAPQGPGGAGGPGEAPPQSAASGPVEKGKQDALSGSPMSPPQNPEEQVPYLTGYIQGLQEKMESLAVQDVPGAGTEGQAKKQQQPLRVA